MCCSCCSSVVAGSKGEGRGGLIMLYGARNSGVSTRYILRAGEELYKGRRGFLCT